jgi:hypothetical protein
VPKTGKDQSALINSADKNRAAIGDGPDNDIWHVSLLAHSMFPENPTLAQRLRVVDNAYMQPKHNPRESAGREVSTGAGEVRKVVGRLSAFDVFLSDELEKVP